MIINNLNDFMETFGEPKKGFLSAIEVELLKGSKDSYVVVAKDYEEFARVHQTLLDNKVIIDALGYLQDLGHELYPL